MNYSIWTLARLLLDRCNTDSNLWYNYQYCQSPCCIADTERRIKVCRLERQSCFENTNEMSSDLTLKRQNAIWCQPESAMFCAPLSHFRYAVQLLPGRGFSYRACDEEMSKPLLILTLLKIINWYQWYINFVLKLIGYLNNISKAAALKVLISVVGQCLQ